MFIIIPTGRKYTSTVRSEYTRNCVCENCKAAFSYKFTVTGTGTGHSTFWLRNEAAGEEAKDAAKRSMEKNAQAAFPPVACPTCSHFQRAMVNYYRKTRLPQLFVFSTTCFCIVAMLSAIFAIKVGVVSVLQSEVFWIALLLSGAMLGYVLYIRTHAVPKKKPSDSLVALGNNFSGGKDVTQQVASSLNVPAERAPVPIQSIPGSASAFASSVMFAAPKDAAMNIREFDFNALPHAVRERFVAAIKSKDNADSPIIREVQGIAGLSVGLVLLLLLASSGDLGMLKRGFQEIGDTDAWQTVGQGIFYACVLAAVFYAALALWRRIQMRRAVPYMPGRYLFPLDLVDAQTRQLKMYPLEKLKSFNTVHHDRFGIPRAAISLGFEDGSQQQLAIGSSEAARQGLAQWNTRREELRQASQAQDAAAFSRLDPFFAIRTANWTVASPAPEGEPLTARHLPKSLRWRALIAVGTAVIVAFASLFVRNVMSDDALYKEALRVGTEPAYLDYLRAGRRHVDEIRAGLPRVAFNDAKKIRSVTALRSVLQRYPKAGLQDDVKRELAAAYATALAKFRTQAATSDPTLVPFMEQVLSALNEAGSSTLQVRFTRPSGDELRKVDLRIVQNAGKGREIAPVANHFGSNSAGPRETRIVGELTRGFRAIFPSDVLSVASVTAVNPQLPVMDVTYGIVPSGTLYKLDEAERFFVGVKVHFDVRMSLPASTDDWRFNLDVLPPERFVINFKLPPGVLHGIAPDERVYVVMAERAFDELGLKLRTAFFRPESDAYKRAAGK